jgi:hypothetical protein
MTAPARSTVPILPATLTTTLSTTKDAPAITGAWVDVRSFNGGVLAWSVKNSASAPGVQGQFLIQAADTSDGANASDIWTGGGDTVASSEKTGMARLDAEVSYVRMLGWGNTTNHVTFKLNLFAKA